MTPPPSIAAPADPSSDPAATFKPTPTDMMEAVPSFLSEVPRVRLSIKLALSLLLAPLTGSLVAQSTIRVPADQPTIQAGINAAHTGDTVLVAPGTYFENIDFVGKAITVTTSGGPTVTTLDGSSKAPALQFKTRELRSSIFSGFTVTHGGSEGWNGTYYTYGSPGVLIQGGTAPTLINNVFTYNHCWTLESEGTPLIQNNQINNTQDTNGNCSFAGGAGIWLDGLVPPSSQPLLVPTVMGNLIENNMLSGQEDAGGNGGAGIAVWTSNAVIENNVIRNNITHGNGGGIHLESSNSLVIQNLIYNNKSGGGGGGLATDGYLGPPAAVIANNTFYNNTFGGGGGSSTDYGVSQLALGYFGGYGPSTVLVNNIVVGNSTQPAIACDTYVPEGEGQYFQADHNLFLNTGGPLFVQCADPTGTYGNISVDPQFVNPAAGDFHLKPGSPAIDTGNSSVIGFLASSPIGNSTYGGGKESVTLDKDLDGNPRVSDFIGKGSPTIDMGAYENIGLQDASATSLLLTPSYYSGNAGAPFTLSSHALSAAGTPTGPVTFVQDGVALGTLPLDASANAVFSNAGLKPGIHRFIATYPGQGAFPAAASIETIVVVNKYSVSMTLTSSKNPASLGDAVTFTVHITSFDTNQLGPVKVYDGYTTNSLLATLAPDSTGTASFVISTLATGTHYINATYAGDTTHNSASAPISEVITNPNDTAIVVTSSVNPSLLNSPVTFTATVTSNGGAAPTGSVQFRNGSTLLSTQPLSAAAATGPATASFTTSSLPLGFNYIASTFVPTTPFNSSTTTTLQNVINGYATTTTLTASPSTSTVGQSVTFAAHVASSSGTPTGAVTFTEGGATLSTQTVDGSGNASFSTSSLPPGIHTILATYVPTGAFAGSSASALETVNGYSTTATLTRNPTGDVGYGTLLNLTAAVASNTAPSGAPAPSGTVNFYDNSALLATSTLANGIASASTAALSGGVHSLTCAYSGDGHYASSVCNISAVNVITSTTSALTSSLNPAGSGQSVLFTANISPDPRAGSSLLTGSVSFYDGATLLSTQALGQTSCTNCTVGTRSSAYSTSTLIVGSHPITAVFNPTGAFSTSTVALTQVVYKTSPVTLGLVSSLNPSLSTQSVTFTAKLASVDLADGTPTGTVTFADGGTPLSTQTLAGGLALYTTSTLLAGTHAITATYSPPVTFGPASGALSQIVNLVDNTATLTLNPTQPTPLSNTTLTSTLASANPAITAALTGTVSFSVDGVIRGPIGVSGNLATLTLPPLAIGSHSITCTYSGDTVYKPAACGAANVTVTALPTQITLVPAVNPIYALNTPQFTVQLSSNGSPLANAFVEVTDALPIQGQPRGDYCFGNTDAQGRFVCAITGVNLPPGNYPVTAIFATDGAHAQANSATVTLTILPNPTALSLTATPTTSPQGALLQVVTTVTSGTTSVFPNGNYTLYDNGVSIGVHTLSPNQNGVSTLNLSTLAVGVHHLTATFTGLSLAPYPPYFLDSTSTAVTVTITPSSFTVSTNPTSITIQTGHHKSLTVNLASIGAFSANVHLACATPLPPVLTCTFAHPDLPLGAGGAASTSLNLETDAIPNFYAATSTNKLLSLAALAPLALLAFRRRRRLALLLFALGAFTSLTGCTGHYPISTPPGTYDLVLTAEGVSNGSAQTQTTHLKLVVTP